MRSPSYSRLKEVAIQILFLALGVGLCTLAKAQLESRERAQIALAQGVDERT